MDNINSLPLIPFKNVTHFLFRQLSFTPLTFFLSTLLDPLHFSVNSTCLPKSPVPPYNSTGGLLLPLVLTQPGTVYNSLQLPGLQFEPHKTAASLLEA